jgi:DNA-directed RNA polymerase specialized sigma24 family protein
MNNPAIIQHRHVHARPINPPTDAPSAPPATARTSQRFAYACAMLKRHDSADTQRIVYHEAMRIGTQALHYASQGKHADAIQSDAEDILIEMIFRFIAGLQSSAIRPRTGGEAAFFRQMVKNRCRDAWRRREAFGGVRSQTIADLDLESAHADQRQTERAALLDLMVVVGPFLADAKAELFEKRQLAYELLLERAQEDHPPALRQQVAERFPQMEPGARQVLYDAIRNQTRLLENFLQEQHSKGQI